MSPADDGNRSPAEDEDPSGGIFESGRWFGKSASGLVAAPSVLEQVSVYFPQLSPARINVMQLQNMVPSQGPDNEPSSSSLSIHQALKPDHQPGLVPMEQSASERLQRLIQDCGYSSERLRNMYNELPPRKLRDDLVDHYFTTMFVYHNTFLFRISDFHAPAIGLGIQSPSTNFVLRMLHF